MPLGEEMARKSCPWDLGLFLASNLLVRIVSELICREVWGLTSLELIVPVVTRVLEVGCVAVAGSLQARMGGHKETLLKSIPLPPLTTLTLHPDPFMWQGDLSKCPFEPVVVPVRGSGSTGVKGQHTCFPGHPPCVAQPCVCRAKGPAPVSTF